MEQKYRTHVVIASIDVLDRRDLERIENDYFSSIQEVCDRLGTEHMIIVELSDFVDLVNDQEQEEFNSKWITYVNILCK